MKAKEAGQKPQAFTAASDVSIATEPVSYKLTSIDMDFNSFVDAMTVVMKNVVKEL